MDNVNTSLAVTNETSVRGKALLDLIRQYITFPTSFYGFKSIGANPDVVFPVLFVEPTRQSAQMMTTAKFKISISYNVYWYVRESKSHDAVQLADFIGEALIKLFSNNALGDLGVTNPPSNKFKQYPGFWLDSEMTAVLWSTNYGDPDPRGARYERAGMMTLTVMDVVLK